MIIYRDVDRSNYRATTYIYICDVYIQNSTTKLSILLMSVDKVLDVTSSITSSSSPVDLFCTNHSKTSSSRCSSPGHSFDNYKTIDFRYVRSAIRLGIWACYTFIDDWCLMPIVDQYRQIAQIVFIGQCLVVDLDKTDAQLIGLVVDILQFLQGLGALAALLFIWWTDGCANIRENLTAISTPAQVDIRLGLWFGLCLFLFSCFFFFFGQ